MSAQDRNEVLRHQDLDRALNLRARKRSPNTVTATLHLTFAVPLCSNSLYVLKCCLGKNR